MRFFGTSENRRQDPGLDRGRCVRVSRDRSQASQSRVVIARDVTDSEHYTVRKNTLFSAPYVCCNRARYQRRSKSTDLIMKSVGH
jgi:hypothetical protein